ncbi:hypothetical protein AKJ16_DCAP10167 [Drosera capensis]
MKIVCEYNQNQGNQPQLSRLQHQAKGRQLAATHDASKQKRANLEGQDHSDDEKRAKKLEEVPLKVEKEVAIVKKGLGEEEKEEAAAKGNEEGLGEEEKEEIGEENQESARELWGHKKVDCRKPVHMKKIRVCKAMNQSSDPMVSVTETRSDAMIRDPKVKLPESSPVVGSVQHIIENNESTIQGGGHDALIAGSRFHSLMDVVDAHLEGNDPGVGVAYGWNTRAQCAFLWDNLIQLGRDCVDPWLVMGDFNTYMNVDEKIGFQGVSMEPCPDLKGLFTELGLEGIPATSFYHTWYNNQGEESWLRIKLDRGMGNSIWFDKFTPYRTYGSGSKML